MKHQQPKTSLVAPIALLVAPFLAIVLTIALYAFVNLTASNYMDSVAPTGGPSHVPTDEQLAAGSNYTVTISLANIAMFIVGATAVISLLPCLIVGIVLLKRRLEARRTAKRPVPRQAR